MAASSCQTLPSYKVSIRRTKVLPPASFRPHLTMDPLPLAVCLLWSYRTRDFHPLDYTHAGRTTLCLFEAFPSRGNEKIGGTGYCVTYDTDSQSRNVLASPLGEEGHEVAKGVQANWIHRGAPRPANPVRRHPAKSVWTVVRMIMVFLFYVLSPFAQGAADWRSG